MTSRALFAVLNCHGWEPLWDPGCQVERASPNRLSLQLQDFCIFAFGGQSCSAADVCPGTLECSVRRANPHCLVLAETRGPEVNRQFNQRN